MKVTFSLLSLVCASLLIAGAVPALAAETALSKAPETANLYQKEIQAGAEFALLKDLVEQRKLLSEQAANANQPEKAKWEAELAREFSASADRAAATLEEVVRQRLASQSGSASNAPAAAPAGDDPDETAFFTRLDTQLWRVEQDLRAVVDLNRDLSAQLQTNNASEEVLRISYLAQENNTIARFLERERSDLELQKLQYLALRKSHQPAPVGKSTPPRP